MGRVYKGFLISLSMFTAIPAPAVWDSSAFGWVIPSLPPVGLIVGGLWLCAVRLVSFLAAPQPLLAAVILLAPLFLSGFIHIDGYMDTCDAVFSRADLEKKRSILKDPHVGAFAAIALGVYLTAGFSAAVAVAERGADGPAFLLMPMLSRCVAGGALMLARPISPTGFGADFSKDAGTAQRLTLVCFALVCLAAGFLCGGRVFFPLLGVLAGGVLAGFHAVRQLDGVSGDLCGFIVAAGELCGLIVLATC